VIEPLALPLDQTTRELPAGRSLVEVAIPEGCIVSIGVLGPVEALLDFDVLAPVVTAAIDAHAPLDEDGKPPIFASFRLPLGAASVRVLVDVSEPVSLVRLSADPSDPASLLPPTLNKHKPNSGALTLASSESARALIGLPAPLSRADGYLLES